MQYKKSRIPVIILTLLLLQIAVLVNAVPMRPNLDSSSYSICNITSKQTSIEQNLAYDSYSTEKVPFISQKSENSFFKKFLSVDGVDYTFPMIGYALRAESEIPIEYDDFGLCRIRSSNINNEKAAVTLMVKSGTYTFTEIPINGEFYIDKMGNLVCKYEVEKPHSGFFMKIITDPEITYIELACDGNTSQLCYRNLLQNQKYDFKPFYVKNSIVNFYNQIFAVNRFEEQSFTEMRTTLISNLKNGVKVYQSPQWKEQKESWDTLSITTTDYVISFEAQGLYGDPDFTFAQDMVESDHYLVALTEIDIGIYRAGPSESQVKSDLQYYNKDYFVDGSGYSRNIKAYAPYAHPSKSGEYDSYAGQRWYIRTTGWWIWEEIEYLTYSEVQNLWYYWGNPYEGVYEDVHPTDMIILANVCFGYADGPTGNPYMPKAFVDYGALSYIGCTWYLVSGDIGDDAFWSRLCIWDESVYAATLNYVAAIDQNVNPPYEYGTDIKIYGGTTNAYLGN